MKHRHKNLHQPRKSKDQPAILLHARDHLRHRDSVRSERHGDNKSQNRPRNANIKKRPSRGDRRANAYHRAKSSEREGGRQKKRIAAINSIIPAREIVPHFVRHEKSQQGQRKRNPQQQHSRMLKQQQRNREQFFIARKRFHILRKRSRNQRPRRKRHQQGQTEKNNRGPQRLPPRAHPRRQINNLRIISVQNFQWDAAMPVAGAIAHEGWMPKRENQVRRRAMRQGFGAAAAAGSDCNSLPGLKRTAFPGGMLTCCPVRGLRPMPVFRGFTLNTPKRRNSIRSPRPSAFFIASKTVSTACSAFVRVILVFCTIALTMSSLITRSSRRAETYARQGVAGCQAPSRVIHCPTRNASRASQSAKTSPTVDVFLRGAGVPPALMTLFFEFVAASFSWAPLSLSLIL